MKQVLIVTYHYPPSAAVGGIRPSKFARYLPEFGWRTTVLTVSSSDSSPDETSDGESGGKVIRVPEWPHPLKWYRRARLHQAKRRGHGGELSATADVPFAELLASRRGGLKRWLAACLCIPDPEVSWLVPAVMQGVRLIRRCEMTHLITTGPPFTCHVIGLALKGLTGIKWVAEFRDPWSLSLKFTPYRNRLTDAVEGRLIRAVMRKADCILSVTPSMTDQARKEHADIDQAKFVTLLSGFDSSDFSRLAWSRPAPDPVIFAYFGSFYHGRTPEPFLRALRSLLDEGQIGPGEVRAKFVGHVDYAEGQPVARMVRDYGLADLVTIHPAVPRSEALRQTLEAHVVLVLDEQHPMQIPLKFYEALAAGAVIFNIGSGGAVRDLLAKTGRGVAVNHLSHAEIRRGIVECVRRARSQGAAFAAAPWTDPALASFHFRQLTARLAEYLESAGQTGHAPAGEMPRIRSVNPG